MNFENNCIENPQHYVAAAIAAQTAETELLSRLDWISIQPKKIINLGCGFGHANIALQARYPSAHLIAVDYQRSPLQAIQSRLGATVDVVCADANKTLPFKSGSIDLMFANFLLPWLQPGDALFAEWRRLLSPNGLLMFTALGPDTLKELMPWFPSHHISMPFHVEDMHDLGDALLRAQLTDPVLDINYVNIKYREGEQLLKDLYHSECLSESLASILAKQLLGAAHTSFPMTLTYELIFATAFAPATMDQVRHDNGEVSIAMQTLRQMLKTPKTP